MLLTISCSWKYIWYLRWVKRAMVSKDSFNNLQITFNKVRPQLRITYSMNIWNLTNINWLSVGEKISVLLTISCSKRYIEYLRLVKTTIVFPKKVSKICYSSFLMLYAPTAKSYKKKLILFGRKYQCFKYIEYLIWVKLWIFFPNKLPKYEKLYPYI